MKKNKRDCKKESELRLRQEDAPANATGTSVVGTGDDNNVKTKKMLFLKRKKNKKVEEDIEAPVKDIDVITPDSTFASMPVFKVNSNDFAKCKFGKDKFARWAKHIDTETEYGKKIHSYAKKNPKKSIIVQDDKSGHMVYLKKYSQLEK